MGENGVYKKERAQEIINNINNPPVACYQMMRRGCTVDFVTFNSEPYTPPAYLTKVVGIARKLNEYQKRGKLYAVNILDAQKEIRDKCRSKHRTVLYRRFMMRVASLAHRKVFCHRFIVYLFKTL